MFMKPLWVAIFVGVCVLKGPLHAATVRIEQIDFDRVVTVHNTPLELYGVGLLRYRVVFRAYVGALYLGPEASADEVWSGKTPMRLELEYFWPIRGEDFGEAAAPFLKDNLSPEEYKRIAERAAQLGGLYRDVEPGDRYALTFIPGRGTELALNGAPLGMIEGDDFASSYFRIWLGEKPIDKRFRDQLLTPR